MKQIKLTQGQVTQVDDEDFEYLNQFNWYALYDPGTKSFYATRNCPRLFGKQKKIKMHRVIMNTPEDMQVDHINHDTLYNLRENLRNCTMTQNNRNRGKQADNTSGYKGVSQSRKKWQAQIRVDGKDIHLHTYPTREEAARAYDEAAKMYHGDFAVLNFP